MGSERQWHLALSPILAPINGGASAIYSAHPSSLCESFASQSPIHPVPPRLPLLYRENVSSFSPLRGIRSWRHCRHHPYGLASRRGLAGLALPPPPPPPPCPVPFDSSCCLYKASDHVVRQDGRQEGPAQAALRQRPPPRRRVRAVPGEEGRRGQPLQQPGRRRRHGAGGGAHDLHAQPDRHGIPQGRLGGRRGRVPGGVPRGHGGGRRQGHHPQLCLGTLGVQEQEQPDQQQPQGSLQGLHLRHGGHRGARVMAGAGHPQPAMGFCSRSLPALPVRLDARGTHGAAGAAIGDRAGGDSRGGGAGVDRPGRHVHDAAGDLGRSGCAVLMDV